MLQKLILGGPGAGKTTACLGKAELALNDGVPPERIAFVAFTRAAAGEAKGRACERFGLGERDLPYFRTLHSLAFKELGLHKSNVLGEDSLVELSTATGELMHTVAPSFEGPATRRSADELLTVDHFARTTGLTLHDAWRAHGGEIDWWRLKRFCDAYNFYKEDRGLMDFTDMLANYVGMDLPPVPVDVAIIDEAQDLTMLQWKVALHAFRNVKQLWVAGDDLQSIHKWAGAADEQFLNLGYAQEILPLSHRLPKAIFDFSEQQAARVSKRYHKQWASAGRTGAIEWINRPEEIDLSQGTWLLLGRTRSQLNGLCQLARDQGVMYTMKGIGSVRPEHVRAILGHEALRAGKRIEGTMAYHVLQAAGVKRDISEDRTYDAKELVYDATIIWHDALIRIPVDDREYYLACRRRGENLVKSPRVRIETIHGAKGLEAQSVLLLTDLTYRTRKGYELDPDSEHRVFYVGITRAIETLYLLAPRTAYGYQF